MGSPSAMGELLPFPAGPGQRQRAYHTKLSAKLGNCKPTAITGTFRIASCASKLAEAKKSRSESEEGRRATAATQGSPHPHPDPDDHALRDDRQGEGVLRTALS